MLIRNEFAIEFNMPQAAAMIGLLRLHPSLDARVRFPEMLKVEHLDAAGTAAEVKVDEYVDVYGNRCSRFLAPAGHLKISGEGLVECDAVLDPIAAAIEFVHAYSLVHAHPKTNSFATTEKPNMNCIISAKKLVSSLLRLYPR